MSARRDRLHRALDKVLDAVYGPIAYDEFKESEHPRQKDGKFGEKGAGTSVPKTMPKGMEHATKGEHKTVSSYCMALVSEGKYSNADIAQAAQVQFGGKTTPACVAWYKMKAKKESPEGIKAAALKKAGVKANNAAIAQAAVKPAPSVKVDAALKAAEVAGSKTMHVSCVDVDGKKVFVKVPGVPDGLDNAESLKGLLADQGYKVQFASKYDPSKPAPPDGYTDVELSPDKIQKAKDAAYAKAQKGAEEAKKAKIINAPVTELDEPLSPDMIKAIKGYTDGSYGSLNRSLRNGQPMSSTEATLAAQLDAAFSRARLAKDTVLYRKMSHPGKFFGPAVTVGTTVVDNGYISTSKSASAWSGSVSCEIHCKKGARALDVQANSLYSGEEEVMLPRGSMFKVIGVKPDGTVQLDYVSQ